MTSIEERVRKASRARAPTTMTRWMKDHEQPTSSLSWHKTCKLNHHLSQFIFHSSSLLVFLSLNLPLLHTRHAFMRSLQCCVTGHSRSHSIFRDAPNCCMQIVRFHAPLEITWRQQQKRTETEKKPVHVSVLLTSSEWSWSNRTWQKMREKCDVCRMFMFKSNKVSTKFLWWFFLFTLSGSQDSMTRQHHEATEISFD